MAPTQPRRQRDVDVMLADGGETISDMTVLLDQPDLFGTVATHPTALGKLDAIDDAVLERIGRGEHGNRFVSRWTLDGTMTRAIQRLCMFGARQPDGNRRITSP
jgi:hypothetical protein